MTSIAFGKRFGGSINDVPRLGLGSQLMPNARQVYIREAEAQVNRRGLVRLWVAEVTGLWHEYCFA
jgi:hypothetical protein